ncbi:MAG: pyridoxal phosphate-dependent aminotransferase [Bacteroidetes bacterium]|nr:pyridoxal phosphate-dependent aminotransferase [Bacteroidota bacterium]
MPTISQRGQQMPASPIRKLVPFAEAAKARGTKVYHLNIGQPDLPTPAPFWDAVRQFCNTPVLEYSHSAGILSYRQALCDYFLRRHKLSLTPDNIIITNGGSEAVRFAMAACLNPGDEVIVPEPFYANYNSFAIESGVKIVPLTTYVTESFDLPPVEAFAACITPRTKAIILCNPSNPTGKLYSDADLAKLREIVLKHDLYLFSDEAYQEFAYDGETFRSALSLEGMEQHVVVMDTVSKRWSACGARIGAFITRNTELYNAAMRLAQARLSPPTLGQIGSQALCILPDSYYTEVQAEYVARRDTVINALQQIPGVICPRVSGAFYVMPSLPIDDSDRFCQWLLEEFSHEGYTVMMAPGTGFYATPGLGRQEVRIAYVLERQHLAHAMQCLAVALEQYPGRVAPQATAKANA